MALGSSYCSQGVPPSFRYHNITFQDLLFTAEHHWKIGAVNFTTSDGVVYDEAQQLFIKGQAAAAWQIVLVMSQVSSLD